MHTTLNDMWSFVGQIFGIQGEQSFEEHQNMVDIHVITIQENFYKVQTLGGEDVWKHRPNLECKK